MPEGSLELSQDPLSQDPPSPASSWCSIHDGSTWEELEEWRASYWRHARRHGEWDRSVCPVKIELHVGWAPARDTPPVRLFAFH